MAVKKAPPREESESGSEFESESEGEPIVEGKQPQTDNKKPESESSSEETDGFVVKASVKRKAADEPSELWSEEATATLIEEWGRRYQDLKKLRKKDWKEVADAVNALRGHRRTEVQCKNRINTIKKKYKLEKRRSSSSSWPFFHRLHSLMEPPSSTPDPMETQTTPTQPHAEDTGHSSSHSAAEKKKPKSSSRASKPQTRKETETQIPKSSLKRNGEASTSRASKRRTRTEAKPEPEPNGTLTQEPQNSTPAFDDWAVLGELLEWSSVPECVWRRGLGLIPDDQKADLAAQCKDIFLAQLDLDARKDLLASTVKRLVFDALKSDKKADDGH